jgi:hypothetical protein
MRVRAKDSERGVVRTELVQASVDARQADLDGRWHRLVETTRARRERVPGGANGVTNARVASRLG